ncbi:hypothetical protein F2Q68_00042156 [Brassica cretica]|uniref:Ribosomal eL28/Mak16 domain-containing protein n=1 Tax=Brassica cretica TaxID=69181 RepID=A0A8S9MQ71_BRACR|nr:hypothetical protein F2Q68_00042156 [Brassica cretica]
MVSLAFGGNPSLYWLKLQTKTLRRQKLRRNARRAEWTRRTITNPTRPTKKQNKPKVSVNKSILKKEFPRMSKAVANQVVDNYYRPDLKKFALARLSVISKSLRVAKSGAKQRNRQA